MEKNEQLKGKWAWVLVVLAVIYGISPVDILPDVPGVGWVDDIVFLVVTIANLIQQKSVNRNPSLSKMMKTVKWILLLFGILVVFLIMLLGVGIYKLMS